MSVDAVRIKRVAIVSPSSTVAGVFPWVFEQGLARLRTVFSCEPVVMPHCLNTDATQADRASDLHAAFADPTIDAVMACTGGDEQIQLISHLRPEIFARNAKPFFGYSDNTHLCNFLFSHGVKSFYGGSIMSQLAMQHAMAQETVASYEWALLRRESWFTLQSASYCLDQDHPWDDPKFLNIPRLQEPNTDGHIFAGPIDAVAEGMLWGGCLESLNDLMRVWPRVPQDFEKMILFLETSEEIPSAAYVRRFMVTLGEAGVLGKIRGLLVGRPKTWFFDQQMTPAQKVEYRRTQIEAIGAVTEFYNPHIPIVQNLSIGHCDPQLILPYGGRAQIDTKHATIRVAF